MRISPTTPPTPSNQQTADHPTDRGRPLIFHTTLLAEILTTAPGHFVEQVDLLAWQEFQFTPQRCIQSPIVSHGGCPVSAADVHVHWPCYALRL